MTSTDVIGIEEVAEFLGTPRFVVDKLAASGEIPAEKLEGNWRFHRELVEDCLAAAATENSSQVLIPPTDAAAFQMEFFDLDEHAATVGPWDIQLDQLSKGAFHSKLDCVKLPGMLVYDEHWARAAKVRGSTPNGLIMLGTNAAWRRSQFSWCNQTVDLRRFACAGPESEMNFLVPDDGHDVVLLVEPQLLHSATDEETVEKLCSSGYLNMTALGGSRLFTAIRAVTGSYTKRPQLLDVPGEVNAVRSALLEAVADAVGDNSRLESTLSLSAQELVFSQATELIHKSTTPITVLELAQGAGVGIRALEYAFREVMKTTPSAYLRLHRLNRVRQDLLAADPQVNTVTEVASRWGFAHPGRFSVGYRALFREKPSETLRKPTYMKTSRYLVPAKSAV